MVLIDGHAGIGKTRLLREVRARAAGARVLAARGSQLEKEYGYGVVRQLFEPIVAGADRAAIFAGAAGPSRGVSTSHTDHSGPAGDTTFGVLHGLYWLTTDLAASGPIVSTVDDVQWCDVGSLRFLGFLAPHMHALGAPPGPSPQITGIGPGALSLAVTKAWEITLTGANRHGAAELARLALSGGTLDSVDQGFMGSIARNVLEVAEASPPDQWDDALAKAYRKGDLFAVLAAQVWGGYATLATG